MINKIDPGFPPDLPAVFAGAVVSAVAVFASTIRIVAGAFDCSHNV
jgi:hypothetical protein